jgi:hypothetical protein
MSESQQNSQGLLPPGVDLITWEGFSGLNTNASRVGIKDTELFICDGFFPLGPNWLRTLPGSGTPIWNSTAGGHPPVAVFGFVNILSVSYCLVFLTDGSIWSVKLFVSPVVVTNIAPAGTITNPQINTLGVTVFSGANQIALIIADQTNGYFAWDGTVFYQPGSVFGDPVVSDGGSGYSASPTATVNGGSGSGATFSVTVSGGSITAITTVTPGSGYTAADGITLPLTITDSTGTGAAATIALAPFGISGTAITVYSGRVWIGNGFNLVYSAAGSASDFSTTDGGGVSPSNDPTLRYAYLGLISTNGFLYLVGDSSVSYLSGVNSSSSGGVTTTTFSIQNADPQTGTPYPATIGLLGQDVLFANSFGAHASYGGRVTKLSDNLDGIYATVPGFGGMQLSAAVATIYGKRVWMMLANVIDQVSGAAVNKLLMWDRQKWWTSQQDVTLNFIASQEINSLLTAYGTDGNIITPLFQSPTIGFTKTAQSRLWSRPHYAVGKVTSRLWGLAQYYNTTSPDLTISIDQENVASSYTLTMPPTLDASGDISVFGPTAVGQQGALIGMTISTTAADMALLSVALGNTIMQWRG